MQGGADLGGVLLVQVGLHGYREHGQGVGEELGEGLTHQRRGAKHRKQSHTGRKVKGLVHTGVVSNIGSKVAMVIEGHVLSL